MYRRAWFKLPLDLIDFLNKEKIPKERIVSILVDKCGEFLLIWEEKEPDENL